MKTFQEFQEFVNEVAMYKKTMPKEQWLTYGALGCAGEGGEVAEKVKKLLRDNGGVMTETIRQSIIKELGDMQFYIAVVAEEINTTLEEVATKCRTKLLARKAAGTLQGSGDDR